MTDQLYHLVAAELWEAAKRSKQPYFPATYAQDGFIHLTGDPAFLLKVANHFYRDSAHADWLLLVLDPARLTAKVVFEAAAPVGNKATFTSDGSTQGEQQEQESGPLFPHLYGTIDYEAVVAEVPVERAADGSFTSIPGYATAAPQP